MHNSITVSYKRNTFIVTASINLGAIKQIKEIKTSDEANNIAKKMRKLFIKRGIEIEIFELW